MSPTGSRAHLNGMTSDEAVYLQATSHVSVRALGALTQASTVTALRRANPSQAVSEATVATLVGSIGLIAAVPATTALAALLALHLPERRLRAEAAHAH